MDEKEEPVLLADVPCQPGARLDFEWGLGNELLLCDISPSGEHEPARPSASTVRWGAPSDAQRRVAFDTMPHYCSLQEQRLQSGSNSPKEILEFSHTVSAILAADEPRSDESEELEEAGEEENVLGDERAVWELLELFFVGTARTQGVISEDLAMWLQRNHRAISGFSGSLKLALAELASAPAPEEASGYWPALLRCVAVGRTEDALDLLDRHSAWERRYHPEHDPGMEALMSVLEPTLILLKKMPHFKREGSEDASGRAYESLPEFLHYRRHWQAECLKLARDDSVWSGAAAASPSTAAGARAVLWMLAGDEAALRGAAANWAELLVAELLHIYPTLKPQAELAYLVSRCQQLCPPLEAAAAAPSLLLQGGFLRELLEAGADLDAQAVMRICSASCSPWLMAHIPLLMAAHPPAAAALYRPLEAIGTHQVELYTLEYAASLSPGRTTWPLAARYLAWCPVFGEGALGDLLARVPVGDPDERAARQALQLARAFELPAAADRICSVVGMARWRDGQLSLALQWLLRARDTRQAEAVVAPLVDALEASLQDLSAPGIEVPGLEDLGGMLDALAAADDPGAAEGWPVAGPSRGTLGLLQGALVLRRAEAVLAKEGAPAEKVREAASAARRAVLALAVGGLAPARLVLPLLFHAIPLLEAAPPAFAHSDVQALLSRVQDVVMPHLEKPGRPSGRNPDAERGMLQAVRLALARALARTHIAEATPVATEG